MSVVRPETLAAALDALAAAPQAQVLAGGTDFMVEVNFGHRRPGDVVAVRRVAELRGWRQEPDGTLVLGAGLTYTQILSQLGATLPGLAAAARTVGSPQIRNAGTLGGNLGTASPAGDLLPMLAALDAEVVVVAADGVRRLPLGDFVLGVKRTALRPGELILEVRVRPVTGPQQFLKVGTRNAMVISIACLALVLDVEGRRVRCGLGSVAPVPLRPTQAESFAEGALDWDTLRPDPDVAKRFGELVAQATAPIDDHRSSAVYRRHAVGVLAARALQRSLVQQ